jgi:hypothetical protein
MASEEGWIAARSSYTTAIHRHSYEISETVLVGFNHSLSLTFVIDPQMVCCPVLPTAHASLSTALNIF